MTVAQSKSEIKVITRQNREGATKENTRDSVKVGVTTPRRSGGRSSHDSCQPIKQVNMRQINEEDEEDEDDDDYEESSASVISVRPKCESSSRVPTDRDALFV